MAETLEFVRAHALMLPPLAKFAVGMAIIVGVPALSKRLRLPAVVGLLLSGVVLGPHVLDVFGDKRPIADFFADLGKLLLMFFAGLEIDLALFRRAQRKAVTFGLITTSLPLLLGTAVGLLFGYHVVTAVVLGSLLASHTLLGLPIITRIGATRLEPFTITGRLRDVCLDLRTGLFHVRTRAAADRDRCLRPAPAVHRESGRALPPRQRKGR
jgi:Kef-type K+ transport system membrane component KefB